MISNLPPSPAVAAASDPPRLEAFQEAAQRGEWLHVSRDGAQWHVKAAGTTPSQRAVAWIEPDSDTTSAFVAALGQSFSRGIQAAVAHELDLQPAPGRPLSGRTVLQAIDMAQTSRTALQGVDFLTRLQVSAARGSEAFMSACRELGLEPQSVSTQQRQQIDERMLVRFESAQAGNSSPVAEALAREWLAQELTNIR
ncbi:hypothetical protein C6568_16060 [Melaminivora suipulveris]|uniref:Uncharacterized protein n=1 Tax=Melaminivora suipulveris TaxID=2109913 RepID=A0A2R3QFP0_9BURK|nr:hypothetical protein [Melaminivora suipulveris]AVO50579.1 hypothetical protein C6568_16060 [Melaminivora suipulveris]